MRKSGVDKSLRTSIKFIEGISKANKLKPNVNNSLDTDKSISKLSHRNANNSNYFKGFVKGIMTPNDGKSELGKDDSLEKIMGEGKGSLIEMIQNANIDQKVLSLLDDTLEIFNDKSTHTLSNNEKEKYESIEKTVFEKLKKDNEDFKAEASKKKEAINTLNNNYNKTKNDLNSLTQKLNNQDKSKAEYVNKIYKLQDTLRDLTLSNHKIGESINKERVEKDNIFRSLIYFQNKNNAKLPTQLKEIYTKFNNDQLTKSHDVNKLDDVGILKNRIEHLEFILKEKNQEINMKKEIIRDAIEKKIVQEE